MWVILCTGPLGSLQSRGYASIRAVVPRGYAPTPLGDAHRRVAALWRETGSKAFLRWKQALEGELDAKPQPHTNRTRWR